MLPCYCYNFHFFNINLCFSLTIIQKYPYFFYTIKTVRVTPAYPYFCEGDECIRSGPNDGGWHQNIYIITFSCWIICFMYVIVVMSVLYKTVLSLELKAEKFKFTPKFRSVEKDRRKSKRIRIQGMMYGGSLLLCCSATLFSLIFIIGDNYNHLYLRAVISNISLPLQGVCNCIIYLSPRFLTNWDKPLPKQACP
jgi:hypothetical protein